MILAISWLVKEMWLFHWSMRCVAIYDTSYEYSKGIHQWDSIGALTVWIKKKIGLFSLFQLYQASAQWFVEGQVTCIFTPVSMVYYLQKEVKTEKQNQGKHVTDTGLLAAAVTTVNKSLQWVFTACSANTSLFKKRPRTASRGHS